MTFSQSENPFAEKIRQAIQESGIHIPKHVDKLPENWITPEEIPAELKEKVVSLMARIEAAKMPLPLLHITQNKVVGKDGSSQSTGFLEKIQTEGLKVNTNCAAFLFRDLSGTNEPHLASPAEMREHPEYFINDFQIAIKKYIHHGIRVNKEQLKSLVRVKVGMPIVVLADREATPLKRGKDGDEHYVTRSKIRPSKIIGTLNLEGVQIEQKNELFDLLNTFIETINIYLDKMQIKTDSPLVPAAP